MDIVSERQIMICDWFQTVLKFPRSSLAIKARHRKRACDLGWSIHSFEGHSDSCFQSRTRLWLNVRCLAC